MYLQQASKDFRLIETHSEAHLIYSSIAADRGRWVFPEKLQLHPMPSTVAHCIRLETLSFDFHLPESLLVCLVARLETIEDVMD